MIAFEHVHKPICGDVLSLGRQTVIFDEQKLLSVLTDMEFNRKSTRLSTIPIRFRPKATSAGATSLTNVFGDLLV